MTVEQRAQISERFLGNRFNVGRKMPEPHRRKIAEALKGKPHKDSFLSTITAEKAAAIVAQYEAGEGLVRLSEANGTWHRTMRAFLVEQGVEIRQASQKKP